MGAHRTPVRHTAVRDITRKAGQLGRAPEDQRPAVRAYDDGHHEQRPGGESEEHPECEAHGGYSLSGSRLRWPLQQIGQRGLDARALLCRDQTEQYRLESRVARAREDVLPAVGLEELLL